MNFHRCSCSPLRYFFHCSNLRSLRSSSRQGFPVSIISIHRDAGDRTNQTGKMAVVQPSRQHPLIWVWVGISLEWGWSQFHRRKAYYNSRTSSFCKGLGQIDTNLAVGSTFSMTLPKIEWSNVTNCQSIVDSLDPYQLGQFQKPQLFDDYMGTYITQIYIAKDFQTPVVPHKAVAEVSKIGNLSESLAVVNHGWQNEPTDGSWFYLSVYPSVCLSVHLSSCFLSSDLFFLYLSVYLSACLSIDRSIYRSIFQSTDVSIDLCIYVSIYLSTYLSTYQSIYISIHSSIHLSIYPFLNLSIHFLIYPSVHLSIYPSIYLPIYRSIRLSVYVSICLSIYLSVCLSVYLSLYLSYLSVYLSTDLTIYLSVYLSTDLTIYLSICLSIYRSNYLSICLSIYFSTCRSMYLSLCLSIYVSKLFCETFLKFGS